MRIWTSEPRTSSPLQTSRTGDRARPFVIYKKLITWSIVMEMIGKSSNRRNLLIWSNYFQRNGLMADWQAPESDQFVRENIQGRWLGKPLGLPSQRLVLKFYFWPCRKIFNFSIPEVAANKHNSLPNKNLLVLGTFLHNDENVIFSYCKFYVLININ